MRDRGGQSSVRYAVVFREGASAPTAGRLVVEDERLLLVGRRGEGRVELSVAYAELREVRIGRSPGERLNGCPALVLERGNGPPVQIEPLGVGLLHELADLLAVLVAEHADNSEQVSVIVPLKRGCVEQARELVAQGPPFDPAALGLKRHQVFITAREAVFGLCRAAGAKEARACDTKPDPLGRRARLDGLHRRATTPLEPTRGPARRRRPTCLQLGRRQRPGLKAKVLA